MENTLITNERYGIISNIKSSNRGSLPYNKQADVSLTTASLNDVVTAYIVNKILNRLLANDMYLHGLIAKANSSLQNINPFLKKTYNIGEKIYYNISEEFSTDKNKKFQILVALQNNFSVEPNETNIVNYDRFYELTKTKTTSEISAWAKQGHYYWAEQLFVLDKTSIEFIPILKRTTIENMHVNQLHDYIKADYINYSTEYTSDDYVVSAGYSKTPIQLLAKTTSWPANNYLYASESIFLQSYSWYRIYKSGFVEQGGISKPFSLPEQWATQNDKCLITTKLPVAANCLNLSYNFVLNDTNWITKYDSNYDINTLLMYHMLNGRKTEQNYTYKNIVGSPTANVGNKLSRVSKNEFSVWLSYETFNLDASDIGKTDSTIHKLSWKMTGIL